VAPPGKALLLSLILRDLRKSMAMVPLAAAVAVAEAFPGVDAKIKWPNDVWIDGRKVAGILVEGRPQEGWAVVGIGLNVAVDVARLPPELRELAATLGRPPDALEPTLAELLAALDARLAQPAEAAIADLRRRDALDGRPLRWSGGEGHGAGIDAQGRLLVRAPDGEVRALEAGEVHLGTAAGRA